MIYFINTSLATHRSGVDVAQISRKQMFNRHAMASKILLIGKSRNLHITMEALSFTPDDYLSIFDYYQEARRVAPKLMTVDRVFPELAEGQTTKPLPNGGMMAIRTNSEKLLTAVDYYNADDKLWRADIYDERGFLSEVRILEPNDTERGFEYSVSQFFTPDGLLAMEFFYNQNQAIDSNVSRVILYRRDGSIVEFPGMPEFQRYFLDEVNLREDKNNIFISDRALEASWPLTNMQTPARKVAQLHADHVYDHHHLQTSPINFNYGQIFDNLAAWDLILVPTQYQLDTIAKRYDVSRFKVAPTGFVSDDLLAQSQVPMTHRTPGKIVVMSRLAVEKRLSHMIEAVTQVHDAHPKMTLHFYGYANGSEGSKLRELVRTKQAEDYIEFHNFTTDISEVLNSAQLTLLTSQDEGFSLQLLEAMSHGVPAVSYNVPYGPAELIQDDVTGLLVPDADVNALARAIDQLISQPEKLQQLSTASYLRANQYSETKVWQRWETIFDDLDGQL